MKTLKRHHIIERLLLICDTEKQKERFEIQLFFTTTKELHEIYARQEPKLKMREKAWTRLIKRQERRAAFVESLNKHNAWYKRWSARYVRPEIKYPMFRDDPSAPKKLRYYKREVIPLTVEILQFGLVELYETALLLWLHSGNEDGASTCRMIGMNPARRKTPRFTLVPKNVVDTFRTTVESNQVVS